MLLLQWLFRTNLILKFITKLCYCSMHTKMSLPDYICDYCSRSFTRKYNLQTHIENCHLNSSCYCDICEQRFGSPAGLYLHLSRGHNRFGQGFPECDLCGRVFTRKQNITSHMMTVHFSSHRSVVTCPLCHKSFTTERNLKRHINQLHNPDIEYPTCNVCNKVFKGKHALLAHIETSFCHSKGVIKCDVCEKVYTNTRNLKRHVEMQHGEKGEFKCDMCPKVYTSNQSLRRHTRSRHRSENNFQFSCQFCHKLIIGKENLDSHVSFYHRGDVSINGCETLDSSKYDLLCEICNMRYKKQYLLRQHMKTVHTFQEFYDYCKKSLLRSTRNRHVDAKKPHSRRKYPQFDCEFCADEFMIVYDLKDHMKSVHDVDYCMSTCNVCFKRFFSKVSIYQHKQICIPPKNVNKCSLCDKLFTDISSLDFHIKIFHPQAQITTQNITTSNVDESIDTCSYKCIHCERIYYSERSLKHHTKLKHTTDEEVECQQCGKICNNKYYLASHIKIVHNNDTWSKCDYCDKQFKSKRNIRRHIEYTHLGMQRYKCIECETLFKEKRSLRKHVRVKHPNSTAFPQCHICQKRFESAKSCKIHLKLLHSFNLNTHPCDLCSVSFDTLEALNIHLSTQHLAEDVIYKCQECNLVFKGHEKFSCHKETFHSLPTSKEAMLPRCVICIKDFSSRKTLKRHIKKFHSEFNVDELATYGTRKRVLNVNCVECTNNFNDDYYIGVYMKSQCLSESIVFKCEYCHSSYNCLEFAIQRYKQTFDVSQSKLYLSELCTTQMSDDSRFDSNCTMEPEGSMTNLKQDTSNDTEFEASDDKFDTFDIKYEEYIDKFEVSDDFLATCEIKLEPMTP